MGIFMKLFIVLHLSWVKDFLTVVRVGDTSWRPVTKDECHQATLVSTEQLSRHYRKVRTAIKPLHQQVSMN